MIPFKHLRSLADLAEARLLGHVPTPAERAAYPGEFVSMRDPDTNDNWIGTADFAFYEKFIVATEVARQLNLTRKQDRVMLFHAVLYGNLCLPARDPFEVVE